SEHAAQPRPVQESDDRTDRPKGRGDPYGGDRGAGKGTGSLAADDPHRPCRAQRVKGQVGVREVDDGWPLPRDAAKLASSGSIRLRRTWSPPRLPAARRTPSDRLLRQSPAGRFW